MEYKKGYVAFIDILGFSNFVSDEQSAEKVKELFEFIKKFQCAMNSSQDLDTKVAFFSDSIVFTTENTLKYGLDMIFTAIWTAELYLNQYLKLYFRGGITKGLYYHEGEIAFGPGIVKAYALESQAKYSRILIDSDIVSELGENKLTIMQDVDGQYCFNPFGLGLLRYTDSSTINKADLLKAMSVERELLCKAIQSNLNTKVCEKYLWRIIPYNKMCGMLPTILSELKFELTEEDYIQCESLKVALEDIQI